MKKGRLLVISGLSGSGKDAVIEEFLLKRKDFKRLITCADRPKRIGEIHGVHYYFITEREMDELYIKGKLVEKPVKYGTSRKATPKKEFEKIIKTGQNLVWRIESSLASFVATGKFFDEQFPKDKSKYLKESTTVIFIIANKRDVEKRRKLRDGKSYNAKDYTLRDSQDRIIMKKYGHLFNHIIENKDGLLSETVEKIVKLISGFD